MAKLKVSIHEAKSSLSRLIQKALRGEQIIIAKRNVPLVELTVVKSDSKILGRFIDKVWISDDFDAELEDFKDY